MKNKYWVEGDVAWIELTQGQKTCVDVEDLPKLALHKWCAQKSNHGYRAISEANHKTILMHQVLAGDGRIVDHEDGNPLNNRRGNLRPCTQAQNACNQKVRKSNTSGYKGVMLHKPSGRWKAYITHQGHQLHLGYFEILEQAARAYNTAATKLHGAFARLNSVSV